MVFLAKLKFATMCDEVGIKFIGPSGAVMDAWEIESVTREQMIRLEFQLSQDLMVKFTRLKRRLQLQKNWLSSHA